MTSLSGKDFCKALEARGWVLQQIKGSHHIYAHPDFPAIITVPVHGHTDLKKGLLRQLLKQAGIPETDL